MSTPKPIYFTASPYHTNCSGTSTVLPFRTPCDYGSGHNDYIDSSVYACPLCWMTICGSYMSIGNVKNKSTSPAEYWTHECEFEEEFARRRIEEWVRMGWAGGKNPKESKRGTEVVVLNDDVDMDKKDDDKEDKKGRGGRTGIQLDIRERK